MIAYHLPWTTTSWLFATKRSAVAGDAHCFASSDSIDRECSACALMSDTVLRELAHHELSCIGGFSCQRDVVGRYFLMSVTRISLTEAWLSVLARDDAGRHTYLGNNLVALNCVALTSTERGCLDKSGDSDACKHKWEFGICCFQHPKLTGSEWKASVSEQACALARC